MSSNENAREKRREVQENGDAGPGIPTAEEEIGGTGFSRLVLLLAVVFVSLLFIVGLALQIDFLLETLSDAFADASVLFLGTTRKLRNATEGMFQFAGLSNQTAGALLESTLRATSNTTTEVAFTIGEFLGKPRVRGLISSLAAGAAVTSFHWIVLYWDSDIPGRNPPAPVSPAKSWRKNELQKGGGTGLHLSYMVGLAHGILTSCMTLYSFYS